jgi:hypothetical protein
VKVDIAALKALRQRREQRAADRLRQSHAAEQNAVENLRQARDAETNLLAAQKANRAAAHAGLSSDAASGRAIQTMVALFAELEHLGQVLGQRRRVAGNQFRQAASATRMNAAQHRKALQAVEVLEPLNARAIAVRRRAESAAEAEMLDQSGISCARMGPRKPR